MSSVRPKKSLGQHFLKDQNIARKIVDSLQLENTQKVLEIGPGTGVLTRILLQRENIELKVIEIDIESVEFLNNNFEELAGRIISGDFLKLDLKLHFNDSFAVIGNFPYNISSQIFFRILENRDLIPEVVGMVQKEVAERMSTGPGSKTYGILSVLVQAFYNIKYLFTVNENVFNPPPKVKSAVIRLVRNDRPVLDCDEKLFFQVVKTAFNQRRKMLGNALRPLGYAVPHEYATMRAEQLSVGDFISITSQFQQSKL